MPQNVCRLRKFLVTRISNRKDTKSAKTELLSPFFALQSSKLLSNPDDFLPRISDGADFFSFFYPRNPRLNPLGLRLRCSALFVSLRLIRTRQSWLRLRCAVFSWFSSPTCPSPQPPFPLF